MIEDLHITPAEALIAFHPIVALLFGTAVGLLAQSIATRLRHNGKWHEMSSGRKWALRWTGALAAYGVGLWVLDHPAPGDTPYVYRLWLYQLAAAWGGAAVLDALVQFLMQWARRNDDQNEPEEGKGDEDRDDA